MNENKQEMMKEKVLLIKLREMSTRNQKTMINIIHQH